MALEARRWLFIGGSFSQYISYTTITPLIPSVIIFVEQVILLLFSIIFIFSFLIADLQCIFSSKSLIYQMFFMITMIAVSKDPAPQFFTNATSGARASNIDDSICRIARHS